MFETVQLLGILFGSSDVLSDNWEHPQLKFLSCDEVLAVTWQAFRKNYQSITYIAYLSAEIKKNCKCLKVLSFAIYRYQSNRLIFRVCQSPLNNTRVLETDLFRGKMGARTSVSVRSMQGTWLTWGLPNIVLAIRQSIWRIMIVISSRSTPAKISITYWSVKPNER